MSLGSGNGSTEQDIMYMKGIHSLRLFKYGMQPREIPAGTDLSFMLLPETGIKGDSLAQES
jgi:hypothetical protein